jgi:hypothetical protein
MKQLIFAAIIAATSITQAFAIGGETVDGRISRKFHEDYKAATAVSWNVTDEYSAATFVLNGMTMEIFYNNDGDPLGTSHKISQDQLPAKALQAAMDKYKGYVVTESIQVDLPYNKESYFVTLAGPGKTVILELNQKGWARIFKTIY